MNKEERENSYRNIVQSVYPIHHAMRDSLRKTRYKMIQEKTMKIAHVLMQESEVEATANGYSKTMGSVLFHMNLIEVLRQIDPQYCPGSMEDLYEFTEEALNNPGGLDDETMQIMLFCAENNIEPNQERLDYAMQMVREEEGKAEENNKEDV